MLRKSPFAHCRLLGPNQGRHTAIENTKLIFKVQLQEGQWASRLFASYRRHVDMVRALLEAGVGVAEADGNAIHFTGQHRHKEICKLLGEHGAVGDVFERENAAVLSLYFAGYSSDHEIREKLLIEKAKLALKKGGNGLTACHEACTQGDSETVKVLLKHGANPPLPRQTLHLASGSCRESSSVGER
jgi:ankyrin repeat protein